MKERVDSCSKPTSTLNSRETKLFQRYWVFLLIKQSEKKSEILKLKLALSRINGRRQ